MNQANLRDLIAATGLVILLKLDSNRRFSARVTLKFDGWPLVAIGELKLELQSGNASFGSKSTICLAVWPSNLTYYLEKQ